MTEIFRQLGFTDFHPHQNGKGRISNFSSISRQLFKAHYDGYHPRMSRQLATVLKRYINTRPKHEKRTPEFVDEIRRKILCLHEYNLQIAKVKYKYPKSEQFDAVLMQYVELECGLLYDTNNHKEVDADHENYITQRVLRLLRVILHDVLQDSKVSLKATVETCDKALLKLFVNLRADYISENTLVTNIIIKLVQKLNLLEEINKLKGKNVPFQKDTFLKDPLVCSIRQNLTTSDYESGIDDDDDDDLIQVIDDPFNCSGLKSVDIFRCQEEYPKVTDNSKSSKDFSMKYGFGKNNFSNNFLMQEMKNDLSDTVCQSKQRYAESNVEKNRNSKSCTDQRLKKSFGRPSKPADFLQVNSNEHFLDFNTPNALNSQPNNVPSNYLNTESQSIREDFFPVNDLASNKNNSKNYESEKFPSRPIDSRHELNTQPFNNQESGKKPEKSSSNVNKEVVNFNNFDRNEVISLDESEVIEIDDYPETYNFSTDIVKTEVPSTAENNKKESSDLAAPLPDTFSANKKPQVTENINGGLITIEILDDDDDDAIGTGPNQTDEGLQSFNNLSLLQSNEIKQEENEENRSPNFPVPNSDDDQNFLNSDKNSRSTSSSGMNGLDTNSNKDSAKEADSAIVISDSEDELVDGSSENNEVTNSPEDIVAGVRPENEDEDAEKDKQKKNEEVSSGVETEETTNQNAEDDKQAEEQEADNAVEKQGNLISVPIMDMSKNDNTFPSNGNDISLEELNKKVVEEQNDMIPETESHPESVEINENQVIHQTDYISAPTDSTDIPMAEEETVENNEESSVVGQMEFESASVNFTDVSEAPAESVTNDGESPLISHHEELSNMREETSERVSEDFEVQSEMQLETETIDAAETPEISEKLEYSALTVVPEMDNICEESVKASNLEERPPAIEEKLCETETTDESLNNVTIEAEKPQDCEPDVEENVSTTELTLVCEKTLNARPESTEDQKIYSEELENKSQETESPESVKVIEKENFETMHEPETTNNELMPQNSQFSTEELNECGTKEAPALEAHSPSVHEVTSDVLNEEVGTTERLPEETENINVDCIPQEKEQSETVHSDEEMNQHVTSEVEISEEKLSETTVVESPEKESDNVLAVESYRPVEQENIATEVCQENIACVQNINCEAIDYSIPAQYSTRAVDICYTKEHSHEENQFHQVQHNLPVYSVNSHSQVTSVPNDEPTITQNIITPHIPVVDSKAMKQNTFALYSLPSTVTDVEFDEYNAQKKIDGGLELLANTAAEQETLAVKTDSEKELPDVSSDVEIQTKLDLPQSTPRRRKSKVRLENKRKSLIRETLPRAVKQFQRRHPLKQNVPVEAENKRVTRNASFKKTEPSALKEMPKHSRTIRTEDSKYKPHDFIAIENSILPPRTNNVYAQKRLIETNTTSEDSNDSCESTLFIDLGDNMKHAEKIVKSVYEEDTICDMLEFVTTEVKDSVCISIPESEGNCISDSFHILKQMEDFVDNNNGKESDQSSTINGEKKSVPAPVASLESDQSSTMDEEKENIPAPVTSAELDQSSTMDEEKENIPAPVTTVESDQSSTIVGEKKNVPLAVTSVETELENNTDEETNTTITDMVIDSPIPKQPADEKILKTTDHSIENILNKPLSIPEVKVVVDANRAETEHQEDVERLENNAPKEKIPEEPPLNKESDSDTISERDKLKVLTIPEVDQEQNSVDNVAIKLHVELVNHEEKSNENNNIIKDICEEKNVQAQPENLTVENLAKSDDNNEKIFKTKAAMKLYEDKGQPDSFMVLQNFKSQEERNIEGLGVRTRLRSKSSEQFKPLTTHFDRSRSVSIDCNSLSISFDSSHDLSTSSSGFSELHDGNEPFESVTIADSPLKEPLDVSVTATVADSINSEKLIEPHVDNQIESVGEQKNLHLIEPLVDNPIQSVNEEKNSLSVPKSPISDEPPVSVSSEVTSEVNIDLGKIIEEQTNNVEDSDKNEKVVEEEKIENEKVIEEQKIEEDNKSIIVQEEIVESQSDGDLIIIDSSLTEETSASSSQLDIAIEVTVSTKPEIPISDPETTKDNLPQAEESVQVPPKILDSKQSPGKSSPEKISKSSKSSDQMKGRTLENTIKKMKEKIEETEKAKKESSMQVLNVEVVEEPTPKSVEKNPDEIKDSKDKSDIEKKQSKKEESKPKDEQKKIRSRSPSKSRSLEKKSDREKISNKSSRSRSSSKSRSLEKRSKHSDSESDRKRRSKSKSLDKEKTTSQEDPNGHKKRRSRSSSKSRTSDGKTKHSSSERSSKHKSSEKDKEKSEDKKDHHRKRSSKSPPKSKSHEIKDKQISEKRKVEEKDKSKEKCEESKSKSIETKSKTKSDENSLDRVKAKSSAASSNTEKETKHSNDVSLKVDHKSTKSKSKKPGKPEEISKKIDQSDEKVESKTNDKHGENQKSKSQSSTKSSDSVSKPEEKEKRDNYKTKPKEKTQENHSKTILENDKHSTSYKKDDHSRSGDKSRRSNSKENTRVENGTRTDKRGRSSKEKYKEDKKIHELSESKEVENLKRKEKMKENEKSCIEEQKPKTTSVEEQKQSSQVIEKNSNQYIEMNGNLAVEVTKTKEEASVNSGLSNREKQKIHCVDIPKKRKYEERQEENGKLVLEKNTSEVLPAKIPKVEKTFAKQIENCLIEQTKKSEEIASTSTICEEIIPVNKDIVSLEPVQNEVASKNNLDTTTTDISCENLTSSVKIQSESMEPEVVERTPDIEPEKNIVEQKLQIVSEVNKVAEIVPEVNKVAEIVPEVKKIAPPTVHKEVLAPTEMQICEAPLKQPVEQLVSSEMQVCDTPLKQATLPEVEVKNKIQVPTPVKLLLQNEIDPPIPTSDSVYVNTVFSSSQNIGNMQVITTSIDSTVKHLAGQDADLSLIPSVSTTITSQCITTTAVADPTVVSSTVHQNKTCLFTFNEDAESVNRGNLNTSEIFHTPIGLDDISPTKLPLASNQSLDFISPSTSIAEISNSMNLVQNLGSSAINFEVADTSEIDMQPTNKQNFGPNFVTRVTEISCFVEKESNADHNYTLGDPLLGGNNEDKSILTTGLSLSNSPEAYETHLEDLSFNESNFIEENGTLEELGLLLPCKKEKPDFDTSIDDPIPGPEDVQNRLKHLNMLVDISHSAQPKMMSVDNTIDHNSSNNDCSENLGIDYAVSNLLILGGSEVTSQNNSFSTIPDIDNINIMESSGPSIYPAKQIMEDPPPEPRADEPNTITPVCNYPAFIPTESQKVVVEPVEQYTITSLDQLKKNYVNVPCKIDEKSKSPVAKSTREPIKPLHRPSKFATFLESVKRDANKTENVKAKDEMENFTVRRNNRTPVFPPKKKNVTQQQHTKSPPETKKIEVLSFDTNLVNQPPEGRIRVKTDLIKANEPKIHSNDSLSSLEYVNEHDQNVASEVVLPFSRPSPSEHKTEDKKIEASKAESVAKLPLKPDSGPTKHARFDKMGNDYIMETILNVRSDSKHKSPKPEMRGHDKPMKKVDADVKKRKLEASGNEVSRDDKRPRILVDNSDKSRGHLKSDSKTTTDDIFDKLLREGPVNKAFAQRLNEQNVKKEVQVISNAEMKNRGYSTVPDSYKKEKNLPQSASAHVHDNARYRDSRYQKRPGYSTNSSNAQLDKRYAEKRHISVPIIDSSSKRFVKNYGNSYSSKSDPCTTRDYKSRDRRMSTEHLNNLFPNSNKPETRHEEDKFSWIDKFSGSGLFDTPPDLFMPSGSKKEDTSSRK